MNRIRKDAQFCAVRPHQLANKYLRAIGKRFPKIASHYSKTQSYSSTAK